MDQNDRQYKWRATFIRYAPLILWTGVIFFLSTEQGSMKATSGFIGPILRFLFPTAPDETLVIYHGYIRKAAHFTEYAILAMFAWRALASWSFKRSRAFKYFLPLLLVALVAATDEFNQSFEPSRTASFRDALLDFSGGVVMVLLLWFIKWPRLGVLRVRASVPPDDR